MYVVWFTLFDTKQTIKWDYSETKLHPQRYLQNPPPPPLSLWPVYILYLVIDEIKDMIEVHHLPRLFTKNFKHEIIMLKYGLEKIFLRVLF